MIELLAFVALALGVSFICSILEAVLLSATPAWVESMRQAGKPVGVRMARLKEDVDRPLAAILSLNTIAHTVGAAGAGAKAGEVFEHAGLGLISAVLTFLILVVSEIVPKTLGALHWRRLAAPVSWMLVPTIWLMLPLVLLSAGITRVLSRGRKRAGISRDEVRALAELGSRQGLFEQTESRVLRQLFRFGTRTVSEIMTPRTVVFALPETRTVGEALDATSGLPFSRIPLFGENHDDVTGMVLKHEILLAGVRGQRDLELSRLRRDIQAVPKLMPLTTLFGRLLDNRDHLALVVDEFGGTAGVIALEDVIETVLGLEIVDEVDTVTDLREYARRLKAEGGLVADPAESAGEQPGSA